MLGCWLALVVVSLELSALAQRFAGPHSAWVWLSWAPVPALFLLLMASSRRLGWPVDEHARGYRGIATLVVSVTLLGWFWAANNRSDGDVTPLLYVPLVNPLELVLLFALYAVARAGFTSLRQLGVPAAEISTPLTGVVGTSVFALLTSAVFRGAHHWAGVAYEAEALMASMLVQAGLSIMWTMLALGLMVSGHLRDRRARWTVGATLIGLVVVKLFFVELGSRAGLARIVSFIGVGVLLLIVGYFAPLPPRREAKLPAPE